MMLGIDPKDQVDSKFFPQEAPRVFCSAGRMAGTTRLPAVTADILAKGTEKDASRISASTTAAPASHKL
jgi:hypothetical protein